MPGIPNSGQHQPPRTPRADGEATRQRILRAAGQLFAERGYAETTSKAICALAQSNLAAVNYHFGSREGLYRTLLRDMHRYLISYDQLERLTRSALAPRDKLAGLIDALTLNVTQGERWQARLWARELLSPSPFLSELIDQEAMPKVRLVLSLLSEITGIPAQDPALLRCLLSVMAPYLMLQVVNREIPSPLTGIFEQTAEELAQHLKTFALAGLEALALEHRKGTL
ncbi:TetR/AcrR family transcriptional regulator [Pseudomonas panipatensis]|uniref:Transcriptional regulator, TetR family n=1 Tax=Pseudomonas panipatensis TaxID=428992 RepID=A0A1G8CHQ2_9PSED|nr:CerR family C-terminal domain-containing protein [Pseudomonas panipatensis]SDH44450.1 transcriptional regulator, TetR family [Pseudomonas panipatensis]SMP64770.1 transcriptional regulator, TetR family [Pseudomonas panipatensis]